MGVSSLQGVAPAALVGAVGVAPHALHGAAADAVKAADGQGCAWPTTTLVSSIVDVIGVELTAFSASACGARQD